MKIVDKYSIEDADCLLSCVHAIGSSRMNYTMKGKFLGYTKSGKARILVFGDRYWHWKDWELQKRIRYIVEKWRITLTGDGKQ